MASAVSSLPTVADIKYEFDVFLSYHSSDREQVARIADQLKGSGLKVWWDQWCVGPGQNWMQEIDAGVRKSRTTAAFLGPGAEGYWQQEEYQLALVVQQKRNNLVMPVLLPGTSEDKIPGFLILRNAVNFSAGLGNEAEFQRLVDAIRSAAAPGPAPPPPAPPPPSGDDEDGDNPIMDLAECLHSDNITFFIGSETRAAATAPPSRDCDISFQLLSDIKIISKHPDILPPADIAALYYSVSKRDSGLELAVADLLRSRARPATGLHDCLARLVPRLMALPRPRGRKPHRQLIVSTSLDTLTERALVAAHVKFARIVVRRSESKFYVNDYRGAKFQLDDTAAGPDGAQYSLANADGMDDFIHSCGARELTGDQAAELFASDEWITPIVFKVRGSSDVPGSCAISSVHLIDVARALALEKTLLDAIGEIVKHTPSVFLGMGYIRPEFRLCVQALLRGDLSSEQPRYLFRSRPDPNSDDCFESSEAKIWKQIKARAQEKGLTIVERTEEEALNLLAQCLDHAG